MQHIEAAVKIEKPKPILRVATKHKLATLFYFLLFSSILYVKEVILRNFS